MQILSDTLSGGCIFLSMEHSQTPLFDLSQKWRLFGLMAVAIARRVAALERAGGGKAWAMASQLELWVRGAVFEINRQIATASEAGEPATEDEAHALNHLKAIALSLLALALFLHGLKTRFTRQGCPASAGDPAAPALWNAAFAPALWAAGLQHSGYRDSS